MYLRTTKRRNADGSEVTYLQLAHNDWDSEKQRSTTRVLHTFGRADDPATIAALRRLAGSIQRACGDASATGTADAPSSTAPRAAPSAAPSAARNLLDRAVALHLDVESYNFAVSTGGAAPMSRAEDRALRKLVDDAREAVDGALLAFVAATAQETPCADPQREAAQLRARVDALHREIEDFGEAAVPDEE